MRGVSWQWRMGSGKNGTTQIGVSDSLGRADENLNFRPLKGSVRRTR